MKKTMMAMIAFTLITGMAIASDNKKTETKKTTKTDCTQKVCKDKKDCTKPCKPASCTKKC